MGDTDSRTTQGTQITDLKLEGLRTEMMLGFRELKSLFESATKTSHEVSEDLCDRVTKLEEARQKDREEFIEWKTKTKIMMGILSVGSGAAGGLIGHFSSIFGA